jgi:FkbM family methyltransferase
MQIGKRNLTTFLRRVAEWESYTAFARMFFVYDKPFRVLYREVLSKGTYPAQLNIRTPTGRREVHLFHWEDLSTLNLIFCRQDYLVPDHLQVAVDIGANIGLSALFWLTRNRNCQAYLYEPVPQNIERIKENLAGLEGRCTIEEMAVSDFRGRVEFGIEETGKLGGIGVDTKATIQVDCLHIMEIVEPILQKHGIIDCLKIDTEGHEIPILKAIDSHCWECIRCVNVEDFASESYLPTYFAGSRRGSAMRFRNTRLV